MSYFVKIWAMPWRAHVVAFLLKMLTKRPDTNRYRDLWLSNIFRNGHKMRKRSSSWILPLLKSFPFKYKNSLLKLIKIKIKIFASRARLVTRIQRKMRRMTKSSRCSSLPPTTFLAKWRTPRTTTSASGTLASTGHRRPMSICSTRLNWGWRARRRPLLGRFVLRNCFLLASAS